LALAVPADAEIFVHPVVDHSHECVDNMERHEGQRRVGRRRVLAGGLLIQIEPAGLRSRPRRCKSAAGRTLPDRTARILLRVIATEPPAIVDALARD